MESSASQEEAAQHVEGSGENERRDGEDVAMFDQAPLPDRSVHPRPLRVLSSIQFQDWRLCIELRHGTSIQIGDSLSFCTQDPCASSTSAMMPDLIAPQYQDYHLRDYHPGLVSFDVVAQLVSEDLGFQLDFSHHELGFILSSPGAGLQSTYSAISSRDSELSLRSALSSMFNCQRLREGEPVLTLYLWNPTPTTPITFPPGSGVADTARAKRAGGASPIPNSRRAEPPALQTAKEPALQTPEPPALRTPAPAPRTSEPALQTPAPALQTPQPALQTPDPPALQTPEPALQTPQPALQTPDPPALQTPAPALRTPEPPALPTAKELALQTPDPPALQTPAPAPQTPAPAPQTPAPASQTSEPALQTPEPALQTTRPPITYTPPEPSFPEPRKKSPPLVVPEKPDRPLEEDDDHGTAFDVNALLQNFQSTQPSHLDYPDDDEGYQRALAAWVEDERDRELQFDMANTTKCQHMEPQHWRQTCHLFHHKEENTEPEYAVAVSGFGRRLLPVQAHSVWWALRSVHGEIGGVMICHSMGIGKTTIALAVHHVQHTINGMWEAVHAAPEEHSFSEEDLSHPDYDKVCPSNDRMLKQHGFDCPCSPRSPTFPIKQKLGISVVLSPLGLIDTWRYEWMQCFAGQKRQKLLVAHGAWEASNEKGLWKLLQGDEEVTRELATDVRSSYKPAKGWEEHDGPSIVTPRLRNSNCLVLSTSQSIVAKFAESPYNAHQRPWTLQEIPYLRKASDPGMGYSTPKPKTVLGTRYQRCVVSMIFKDEFQHQPSEAQSAIQAITNLQARSPASDIALIPMSGTPLTSGPLDIARWVEMMEKRTWRQHQILHRFTGATVRVMGDRWKKAILKVESRSPKDQKELREIRREVQGELPVLVETLFVRSTTKSRIGTHPVVKVPPAVFKTISCEHDEADQSQANEIGKVQQEAFEKKEAARRARYMLQHGGSIGKYVPLSKTNVNTFYRSRVCATFPGLARLEDSDGRPLKLTHAEWMENVAEGTWKPGTPSDPYQSNLDAIVKSSGKLREVSRMLDRFDDTVDGEGKPCRHIFISYFFVVAYIFELWLRKYRGVHKKHLVAINAWKTPSPKLREAELNRFHVDIGSRTSVADQETARIIVATSSAISIGLTLAEAISVSFLEPDYDAGKLAQGFARHCRQGNKNREVYCNIFMAVGNRVEEKIFEISRLRKQIDAVQNRKHKVVEALE